MELHNNFAVNTYNTQCSILYFFFYVGLIKVHFYSYQTRIFENNCEMCGSRTYSKYET